MSTWKMYLRSAAALSVVLGTSMSAVRAQSPHTLAKADVPFAFQYNGHVFSAGTYTVGTTSEHIMFARGAMMCVWA